MAARLLPVALAVVDGAPVVPSLPWLLVALVVDFGVVPVSVELATAFPSLFTVFAGVAAAFNTVVSSFSATTEDGNSERGVGADADTESEGKRLTAPPLVVGTADADGDVTVVDKASTKKGGVCVLIVLRTTSVMLNSRSVESVFAE